MLGSTMHTLRISEPATIDQNAWYQGYETGMAFCRLTRALALEAGTKSEKEQRCLAQTLDRHVSQLCGDGSLTLIDLGTGDGQKMVLVIDALVRAGVESIRYVPVDSNPHISRYAILNILEAAGERGWRRGGADLTIPKGGVEVDFFQDLSGVVGLAKRLEAGTRAFCLLGNTFGNYPALERDAFLSTLHAGMQPGDVFLLGVAARPEAGPDYAEQVRLLEQEYLPGEAFMRLGVDHPQSTFRSRYDAASQCMIHTFERPDMTVQHMGYSFLFDPEEMQCDLTMAGFEVLAEELYPPLEAKSPGCLTIIARKP